MDHRQIFRNFISCQEISLLLKAMECYCEGKQNLMNNAEMNFHRFPFFVSPIRITSILSLNHRICVYRFNHFSIGLFQIAVILWSVWFRLKSMFSSLDFHYIFDNSFFFLNFDSTPCSSQNTVVEFKFKFPLEYHKKMKKITYSNSWISYIRSIAFNDKDE